MSNIDKQALREVAEKATRGPWEMERENIWFTDEDGYTKHLAYVQQGDDVDDKQDHYNTAFIAAFNPKVALALLDENLQLQREKDAIEAVALALRDDMRQAREQLEAAEKRIADGSKRIAELESNEVREVGNKFLVVRHPGKTPAIKHCTGDLEDFLRKLIEQDPLVTIDIITHRYYGVGGQWVQDAGEYLQMMQGAGIGVKQQEDSVDSDVGRNQPGMVVAVHIGAGDFVKFKGQVFEVEETDFDDHDVTLWFVGGNALKCAAGCPVEVVSAPVAAGIKVKGE
ncbi:ead/Ea22-like family protein [Salmonella enterica]|nr:ead/Ea22-like family protein [Salmonella enterica]EAW3955453.1 ead/Ea22-like family protein [Salmonella enterica subsp. enterica]EDC0985355.1 ead/Ea22-like family protein [Salmonella enterica subsp. enterica serovar Give]EEK0867316.1 ead/Ea22-like family protein [Salmonella enterica subsp. enterica serovar Dublin]ELG9719152.1 ead/Ea22-like family protein [Salmonella enterica subsp. enterica serovar Newbrunswick]